MADCLASGHRCAVDHDDILLGLGKINAPISCGLNYAISLAGNHQDIHKRLGKVNAAALVTRQSVGLATARHGLLFCSD